MIPKKLVPDLIRDVKRFSDHAPEVESNGYVARAVLRQYAKAKCVGLGGPETPDEQWKTRFA